MQKNFKKFKIMGIPSIFVQEIEENKSSNLTKTNYFTRNFVIFLKD